MILQPVHIVRAWRTAFGRLQGTWSDTRPDDLLAHLIRTFLDEFADLPPTAVEALYVGCSNQAGEDNRNVARQTALLAGLSVATHCITFNTLCTSGVEALLAAARAIQVGEADIILVAGVDSMSRSPFVEHRFTHERVDTILGWRFVNPKFPYETLSMIETAERAAQQYGISREMQDLYAHQSRQRYDEAARSGYFQSEIVPMTAPNGKALTHDEQHRIFELVTMANFSPILANGQHITLCNSARAGDGAVLLMLVSERAAKRWNLSPKARLEATSSVSVHPNDMNLSAAIALEKLEFSHGITWRQADALEVSESFAVQPLLTMQKMGIPIEKINPTGGAISAGNPTSAGNLRLVSALLSHFERQPAIRSGIVATCAGLGMGNALFITKN